MDVAIKIRTLRQTYGADVLLPCIESSDDISCQECCSTGFQPLREYFPLANQDLNIPPLILDKVLRFQFLRPQKVQTNL